MDTTDPSTTPPPRKPNPLLWVLAALGVAIVAGGGYFVLHQRSAVPPPPSAAGPNGPTGTPGSLSIPPLAPMPPASDSGASAAATGATAAASDAGAGGPPGDAAPAGDTSNPSQLSVRSWNVFHDHNGFTAAFKGVSPFKGRRDTACTGVLSIADGHLRFQSRTQDDGFDVPLAAVEEVRLNRISVGQRAFHVRLNSGVNYNFTPQGDASVIANVIGRAVRASK